MSAPVELYHANLGASMALTQQRLPPDCDWKRDSIKIHRGEVYLGLKRKRRRAGFGVWLDRDRGTWVLLFGLWSWRWSR